MYHATANVNLMLEEVIQIKSGITINIIDDSVITCDEIIKKQKQFQKALMKKRPAKQKIYIFYLPFY